jgi:asparagine synthase (glutamine-hydrolysing)
LRPWAEEILFDPRTAARGYFEQTYVRRMFDRHIAGEEDASPRIWALLVLELWHRECIDDFRPQRTASSPSSPTV